MQALRMRAKKNGRSLESEIRDILQNAALPADRVKLGSELAALGKRYGGVDLKLKRDRCPFQAADLA